MKIVSILGHFGFGENLLNGQTIKTKIVAEELIRVLGEQEVNLVDTRGGIKSLIKAPFICMGQLKKSKNIVILPAHNGVRVYGVLLPVFKCFFKKRKLHYAVIGGWLPEFLKKHGVLATFLKKFDGIYVETSSMKKALEDMGFENIVIMPNCKKLDILTEDKFVYADGEPYKLCTFSRVEQKKGIDDAISAVKSVNEYYGRNVYTLDIYGPVDSSQTEWFENLKANFPDYVKYGGLVPYDKSVEVLKNHFALLFPTRYWTEGIPGTFIDAYAAGVPVITALWMNSGDIFEEGKQGFGYEFGNTEDFIKILLETADNTQKIMSLKKNCIQKAAEYLPENVLKTLIRNFKERI